MRISKLRRQLASEAARLIYEHQATDLAEATERALDALGVRSHRLEDLPSSEEIRQSLAALARRSGTQRQVQLSVDATDDAYRVFEVLLVPLENVRQDLRYHPEGDVLYHSLQVFDHARDELPYDEEFLTAALLHDVGKGIDPRDHVHAGLEALAGYITERTAWLIEHHMLCHQIADGSLGARKHRRLRESEWYDDLVLLGECDRAGRQQGVEVPDLDEALDYLRELGGMFE